MPRAEIERVSQVSLSNVNVSIDDPNNATAGFFTGNTNGSTVIPAGAYKVMIYQAGFFQDGDINASATINGQPWPPQLPIELTAELDPVNKTYKRLPAITINGNGGRIFYYYQV